MRGEGIKNIVLTEIMSIFNVINTVNKPEVTGP